MPANWQAALDKLENALDARLGESIGVVPMRLGDFGTSPDPDRPAFDVFGLAAEWDASASPAAKMQTQSAVETMVVELRDSEVVGRLIRKGDEIVLYDRPRAPRLVVTRRERLDPGRIAVICGPTVD